MFNLVSRKYKSDWAVEIERGVHMAGLPRKTTGHSGNKKHELYHVWLSILGRCYYPSNPSYRFYGGKGVGLYLPWFDFNVFIQDVGSRPDKDHQLDRIDSSGNYEPSNVRWVHWNENRLHALGRGTYGKGN